MDSDLQQKLYEQYPLIFAQKDLQGSETGMCWGISCGDGWYDILDSVCFLVQERVRQPLENIRMYERLIADDPTRIPQWKERIEEERESILSVQFVQVKEKFGTLRIYHTSDDPYVEGLVSMAESVSSTTCEHCGNRGTTSTKGWYQTLCDPCKIP